MLVFRTPVFVNVSLVFDNLANLEQIFSLNPLEYD